MKFSVLFWNVENFGRTVEDPAVHTARVERVEQHIRSLDPDLFCLCEIQNKVALRSLLMDKFSDYDFGITDGAEGIELLTGWRRDKFEQILFTQRREFKVHENFLRPGSLASVKYDGEFYNFLFLHTDSGTKNRDYSHRQEMFEKIWSLRQTLDAITEGGAAPFVAMGDLNTMGRKQSGQFFKISAQQEIDDLAHDADDNSMHLLAKTHDATWRKGPARPNFESNLDHGLATANITFKMLANVSHIREAEISVDGWNHLAGVEKDDFSENISDHCSIYCEIE